MVWSIQLSISFTQKCFFKRPCKSNLVSGVWRHHAHWLKNVGIWCPASDSRFLLDSIKKSMYVHVGEFVSLVRVLFKIFMGSKSYVCTCK